MISNPWYGGGGKGAHSSLICFSLLLPERRMQSCNTTCYTGSSAERSRRVVTKRERKREGERGGGRMAVQWFLIYGLITVFPSCWRPAVFACITWTFFFFPSHGLVVQWAPARSAPHQNLKRTVARAHRAGRNTRTHVHTRTGTHMRKNTHWLRDKMENGSFSQLSSLPLQQLGNHSIPFTSYWDIILIFTNVPSKGGREKNKPYNREHSSTGVCRLLFTIFHSSEWIWMWKAELSSSTMSMPPSFGRQVALEI